MAKAASTKMKIGRSLYNFENLFSFFHLSLSNFWPELNLYSAKLQVTFTQFRILLHSFPHLDAFVLSWSEKAKSSWLNSWATHTHPLLHHNTKLWENFKWINFSPIVPCHVCRFHHQLNFDEFPCCKCQGSVNNRRISRFNFRRDQVSRRGKVQLNRYEEKTFKS